MHQVNLNRVQLLDARQRCHFTLANQGTFGDQRTTDTPGNWRCHGGIAQIQFCPLHSGLVGGDFGLCLQRLRAGIVVVLTAHGIAVDQGAVTLVLQFCLEGKCLGFAQCCLRAVQIGLQWRRINNKQHVPLFDFAAFFESALEDDTRHPRADLRDTRRNHAATQFVIDRQRLRDDDFSADLDHRRLFFSGRSFTAGTQG